MSSQIKSRDRVRQHGEVFTNEREVNAMLDLVKDETENIESTFLEPACGDGNFLAEILRRKLHIVKLRYGKIISDYTRYAVLAVSSIYGIDILSDNISDCIDRLFDIWLSFYSEVTSCHDDDILRSVRYILSKNILCGDALTLLQDNGEPIIFAEWSFVTGDLIKRRDFRLDMMFDGKADDAALPLFDNGWEYDNDSKTFIPAPIREYPLIDYHKVYEMGKNEGVLFEYE